MDQKGQINHLFRTLGTCHVQTYCQLTFKINSEEEKNKIK